eukprot:3530672-Pyramimonas_sp.AAC.1
MQKGVRRPCDGSRVAPVPAFQGGPARARRACAYDVMSQCRVVFLSRASEDPAKARVVNANSVMYQ